MIFLFLTGVLFFGLGFLILRFELKARDQKRPSKGVVVGYSRGRNLQPKRPMYYTVVEFSAADGICRLIESNVGSNTPMHALGQEIEVLISRTDPKDALIKLKDTMVLGTILSIIGAIELVWFFYKFNFSSISIKTLGISLLITVIAIARIFLPAKEREQKRKKWLEFKKIGVHSRVFLESEKDQIPWIEATALQPQIKVSPKAQSFALSILVAISVGSGAAGAYFYFKTKVFLETAVAIQGRVVEMIAVKSRKTTGYAPLVRFEVQGKTFEFKHSISSNPPSYSVGESVIVLYDPQDPNIARISLGPWNQLIANIFTTISAIFSILAWTSYRRLRITRTGLASAQLQRRSA